MTTRFLENKRHARRDRHHATVSKLLLIPRCRDRDPGNPPRETDCSYSWIPTVTRLSHGNGNSTDYIAVVDAKLRAIMRAASSEVVSGVRKIEALVDQRKVGHNCVGQRKGQRGPREERGIDDLDPAQRPVRAEVDAVHNRSPPPFGDARAVTLSKLDLIPADVERSLARHEVGEQAKRRVDLVTAHLESGEHVPA